MKKIKERKRVKRRLRLLEVPISRFVTKSRLWLPLLFFFFNLLQWRFERVWSYSMNLVSSQDQIHSPFKGKSKQQPSINRVGNRSVAENRSKRGRGTATTAVAATTGRGGHHGLTVVATGRHGQFCPVRCVLPLVPWSADCLFWAICIGLFGLICFLSSLGLTSNHIIFTKVGPKLENLQENSTRPKPSIIGEIVDKMQINAN